MAGAKVPLVVDYGREGTADRLRPGDALRVNASRTDAASINCPPGTAPDAGHRQVGDLWSETDGYYCRSNARTIGPFIDAADLSAWIAARTRISATAVMPPAAICII